MTDAERLAHYGAPSHEDYWIEPRNDPQRQPGRRSALTDHASGWSQTANCRFAFPGKQRWPLVHHQKEAPDASKKT